MAALSKTMKGLVRVEKAFIGLCLLLSVLAICISVVGRRIGHAPAWAEEVVRYLVIWITFIGSGVCFRRQIHYGVDVIRRVPNAAFQKFILTFVLVASIMFEVFLIWIGLKYVSFTRGFGQKTPALAAPIWLVYVSVPIGGIIACLHIVEVFLQDVIGVYKIEEDQGGM